MKIIHHTLKAEVMQEKRVTGKTRPVSFMEKKREVCVGGEWGRGGSGEDLRMGTVAKSFTKIKKFHTRTMSHSDFATRLSFIFESGFVSVLLLHSQNHLKLLQPKSTLTHGKRPEFSTLIGQNLRF